MGVPLTLLDGRHEPGGRIIFASTVPGAFTDLAADLSYVLDRDRTHQPGVELDADLPFSTVASPPTGLDDLITLNRAAGVLIGEGHHPDAAPGVLHRRAAAQGVSVLVYAAQLLGR